MEESLRVQLRAVVKELVANADLATTSIRALRQQTESKLGKEDGFLDAHVDFFKDIAQAEIVSFLQKQTAATSETGGDEGSTDQDGSSKKRKEHKEGKEKKNKDLDAKRQKTDEKEEFAGDGVTNMKPGDKVKVKGLVAMSHLNGQLGVLKEFDAQSKRWAVEVKGEIKNVRANNLEKDEIFEELFSPEKGRPEGSVDTLQSATPAENDASKANHAATPAREEVAPPKTPEPVKAAQLKAASPQTQLPRRFRSFALSGGEDGVLRLWDLEDLKCIRALRGHEGSVTAAAADFDKMQALSASEDGTLRLWNIERGVSLKTFEQPKERESYSSLAVDWKGSRALAGCEGGILKFWDFCSGKHKTIEGLTGVVWTIDAGWGFNRALTGDESDLRIWDVEAMSCLKKIARHHAVSCLAVDWEANLVLTGYHNGGLELISLSTGDTEIRLRGHEHAVSFISLDCKANLAYTSSWDATIKVWDLTKIQQGHKLPDAKQTTDVKFGRVRSCSIGTGGSPQALCGSSSGCLTKIELNSGVEMYQTSNFHMGAVHAVCADWTSR